MFEGASGSGFGVIREADQSIAEAVSQHIVNNTMQVSYPASLPSTYVGFTKLSSDVGSMGSHQRSPSNSGSAELSEPEYIRGVQEEENLGAFAIELYQNIECSEKIFTECNGQNAFDSRRSHISNTFVPKNEGKSNGATGFKKQYGKHKKGPKQISKDDMKDDEEDRWKNVERCREYRSKKKSSVAKDKQRIKELEEENYLLTKEEEERRERVAKTKALYFQLINEGRITMH